MSPEEANTINDAIKLVARFIIYMGGLAAAIAGIWALIDKIKSRGAMAKMTKRLEADEAHMNDQDHKIADHEQRLNGLEENLATSKDDLKDMHELSKLTLSAVQELLKSNLQDGNNHEGMQKASNAIDEYLKDLI